MNVWIYRFIDKNKEVVSEGVLTSSLEINIEDIAPGITSNVYRNTWEIQTYLDMTYPELEYTFEYDLRKVEW